MTEVTGYNLTSKVVNMFYQNKLSLLIFLLLLDTFFTMDYCKLCKKGSHTLCRYKEGPSDNCIEYKKPEFSSSVKNYIVDIHNDIRNHVASGQETRGALGRQPAASNMNTLQWDNELAEMAQRWADQCVGLDAEMQHDQCRITARFDVGQNVLTAVTATLEIPEIAILILNWYKQVESVLPSDVETFSGIQRGKFLIGQYTQLVWAETRFVGCGMSTFRNKNVTDTQAKYLHRLVCNYGPRGNLIGYSVYNRGVPCSKCPYGRCDSVRTSLCQSMEEPYIINEKYDKPKAALKQRTAFHVEMPITLFSTLSLGYILKNNLTEFINNVLQKVNVHLAPDSTKGFEAVSKVNGNLTLNQMLTILVSIMPQLTMSELEREFQKAAGQLYPKATENNHFNDALRKPSNILYHGSLNTFLNDKLFDLENGRVIVNDCRYQKHQCQYEDDELATKTLRSGDIILPNNMIYRRVKGIWFHGRCRCDYVYRSAGVSLNIINNELVVMIFTFIFFIKTLL